MELRIVATFFGGLLSGIFFRSFIDLGPSFAVLTVFISLVIFFYQREILYKMCRHIFICTGFRDISF